MIQRIHFESDDSIETYSAETALATLCSNETLKLLPNGSFF